MGNSQPTNRTGQKVTNQKLENAQKLGVLSLSEHALVEVPSKVFDPSLSKLRTIDLSKNKLKNLGPFHLLSELKSVNLDSNDLHAGSLDPIATLSKLQNLSVADNKLSLAPPSGSPNRPQKRPVADREALPTLPASIKQINISSNALVSVPRSLCSSILVNLERIDLSGNRLAVVPVELTLLPALTDLNLDRNVIAALPEEMGRLRRLKSLSLRDNRIHVASTHFTAHNPQPLPRSLLAETPLIDLNLHGNRLTNTQLNQFDGFQDFLDRRQKVKTKLVSNLDVCGLD